MKPQVYRQGDVLIRRIDTIPAEAQPRKGRQILAAGEVTGHHHEVSAKVGQIFDIQNQVLDADNPGGIAYMQMKAPGQVTHDEHAPIELEAGNYSIMIQREYTPEEIRNVMD